MFKLFRRVPPVVFLVMMGFLSAHASEFEEAARQEDYRVKPLRQVVPAAELDYVGGEITLKPAEGQPKQSIRLACVSREAVSKRCLFFQFVQVMDRGEGAGAAAFDVDRVFLVDGAAKGMVKKDLRFNNWHVTNFYLDHLLVKVPAHILFLWTAAAPAVVDLAIRGPRNLARKIFKPVVIKGVDDLFATGKSRTLAVKDYVNLRNAIFKASRDLPQPIEIGDDAADNAAKEDLSLKDPTLEIAPELLPSLSREELASRAPYLELVSGGLISPAPQVAIPPAPPLKGVDVPFIVDPARVGNITEQNYFRLDVARLLERTQVADFLTYKRDFYRKLEFNPDNYRHFAPYQHLASWRELFHPPIKQLELPIEKYASFFPPFDPRTAQSRFFDPAFQSKIDVDTDSELSFGNELTVVSNGKAYQNKLRMVQEAKTSFYGIVMAFMCQQDSKFLVDEMIRRKKEGIDVRMIVEGLYPATFIRTCVERLERGGVPVLRLSDFFNKKNFLSMMHNKFWIRDDEEAVAGGHNLLDYNSRSDGFTQSDRDTDVLVKGPAVADFVAEFGRLWERYRKPEQISGQDIRDRAAAQIQAERVAGLRGNDLYAERLGNPETRLAGNCRVLVQSPGSKRHSIATVIDAFTSETKSSLLFTSPSAGATPELKTNHWPDRWGRKLVEMAKAGVHVEMIANGVFAGAGDLTNIIEEALLKPNRPPGWKADLYKFFDKHMTMGRARGQRKILTALHQKGLDVWGYSVFYHAKIHQFDRLASMISSFNFDRYSAGNNHESGIICMDESLNRQVEYQLTLDLINSTPMVSANDR